VITMKRSPGCTAIGCGKNSAACFQLLVWVVLAQE